MSRSHSNRLEEVQTPLQLDQLTRNLKTLKAKLEDAKKKKNRSLIDSLTQKINTITREIIGRRNKIID